MTGKSGDFNQDKPESENNNENLPDIESELFTIAGSDEKSSPIVKTDEPPELKPSRPGSVEKIMDEIGSFKAFDTRSLESEGSFDGLKSVDLGLSEDVFGISGNEVVKAKSPVISAEQKPEPVVEIRDEDIPSLGAEIDDDGDLDIPEELTKPGILKRNTTGGNLAVIPRETDTNDNYGYKPDAGSILLEKHRSGFTGVMKVVTGSWNYVLWWHGGMLGDIDNYGFLLADILKKTGFDERVVSDIAKQPLDPVETARRRHLIRDGDEKRYMNKCRQAGFEELFRENVNFTCEFNQSFSFNFVLPTINPLPLIVKGIVENYPPSLSFALSEGEEPSGINNEVWDLLKFSEYLDPLWVRAVELFRTGKNWREATIYSGISDREAENLACALRLCGALNPKLVSRNNHQQTTRGRFFNLLEKISIQTPEVFFGGTDAKARSNYREYLLFLAEMPLKMQSFLHDEITWLKKEMEQKLQDIT